MSFHGRGTNFYTQKSEAAWSRAMVESVTALFRRGRPSVRFSIASIFALLLSISTAPPSLALTVAAPLSSTKITSRFGYRIHPVTNKYSFHNGVDFKAKLNQDVKAVMPGVVVKAGWRGNLGKAVEIYHPDKKLRTIYGHLNKIEVRKGERLQAGTTLGGAGTTGRSTGVHLHLIAKQENGSYIDSSKIIARVVQRVAKEPIADAPVALPKLANAAASMPAMRPAAHLPAIAPLHESVEDGLFGALFVATIQSWVSQLFGGA
jgi:murein DD-endopeptidase MepM/ murein hydrolase activator NlpD